ncbi:MAG: aerobic glycerol-3-phosphate dehydrogenase [Chitinophagales bacterium]|nr:MAG: aerobic glycerol-3-phosphate dehydrogenase [Chitinophagales bacterium]
MSSTNSLSTFSRNETLQRAETIRFDILVIGGGITGAGIALDAASRGMQVALIEKNDFASGTSSRSTKLIHGGLRYLKQFEFALVSEVGKEREILYRNAPHIVYPENMLLPIIEHGSLGRLTTAIGLSIYDWLAGVSFSERKQMLSRRATLRREPLLRKDILLGGALYKEYRTDDARLVIEVMKTAAGFGAACMNYVEANEFIYKDGTVIGASVTDNLEGKKTDIHARITINAAGPWVDHLRAKDHSLHGKKLHLTKGVHIVIPYSRMPIKQAVYFDVPDGRMVFAIPRGKTTYIGTTDTNYFDSPDEPAVTKEDAAYLINAVNFMFPSVQLTMDDIVSSWAGLRPLIHEEGKAPSELSRKDEIFVSSTGLISIAGGKLTGYRKMAERVVNLAAEKLADLDGMSFKNCFTDKIKLSGGDFKDKYELMEYLEMLQQQYARSSADRDILTELVYRYGSNTETLLNSAARAGHLPDRKTLLEAELLYGLQHEAVTSLSDFLIRRTGRLYFDRHSIMDDYALLEEKIASALSWDVTRRKMYDSAFRKVYEAAVNFS